MDLIETKRNRWMRLDGPFCFEWWGSPIVAWVGQSKREHTALNKWVTGILGYRWSLVLGEKNPERERGQEMVAIWQEGSSQ